MRAMGGHITELVCLARDAREFMFKEALRAMRDNEVAHDPSAVFLAVYPLPDMPSGVTPDVRAVPYELALRLA
jgi:hypothetical protein